MLANLRIRSKLLVAFALILIPADGLTIARSRASLQRRSEMIWQQHDEMAEALAAALRGFFQNFGSTDFPCRAGGSGFSWAMSPVRAWPPPSTRR